MSVSYRSLFTWYHIVPVFPPVILFLDGLDMPNGKFGLRFDSDPLFKTCDTFVKTVCETNLCWFILVDATIVVRPVDPTHFIRSENYMRMQAIPSV
jgi:hypothetical protein